MKLIDDISAQAAFLQSVRRDIHAHPELAFEETRTSDLVAKLLTDWGIPIHRGLGKTGVVGTIVGTGAKSGTTSTRAIGLRADMDALPMSEHNTFEHASQHAGKREMMREGLFEKFPCEAVFGMHNMPGIAVGSVAASPGPVLASNNEFKIVVRGKGGHAAMPQLGVDPIPAALQMIQAFQTIITRNKKPLETAVISVTMIHAGSIPNVIPDECVVQGSVRAYTAETLDLIERRMGEIATHTAAVFGAECNFHFQRNYPSTVNHVAETAFVREVLADMLPPEQVITQLPIMAAEDFAFMLEQVPGCYAFIGNGDGDHRLPGHGAGPCVVHNPSYDFNDEILPLGASFFVNLVQRWFAQPRAA
ncbi:MAG: amidohydrolase [Comamonadaceae bacterium]|nr:MAG: amidohydrolase [Comamonadaceae bacterium]